MEFLLNIRAETLYILLGVVMGAICALHIISVLCKEKTSKMLQYVNIFLHIMLFGVLLISNISIELAVAFYMVSIYVYVTANHIAYSRKRREEKSDDL